MQIRLDYMTVEGGQVLVGDDFRVIHNYEAGVLAQPGGALPVRDQVDVAHPRCVCSQRAQGIAQLLVVAEQGCAPGMCGKFLRQIMRALCGMGRIGPVHPGIDRIYGERG